MRFFIAVEGYVGKGKLVHIFLCTNPVIVLVKSGPLQSHQRRLTAADVVRNKSLMQMCLYRTKSLTNKLRC
ncbi:hypothetical protein P8452_04647 [Trifolium repens]|nr:hypothetical protein P8452_04647 [Trifolium repens]